MTGLTPEIRIASTNHTAQRETAEALGLVRGSTLMAKHIGAGNAADQPYQADGEIQGCSSLPAGAVDQTSEEVSRKGADTDVRFRMQTCAISNGTPKIVDFSVAVHLP